jgi:ABC-type branched-subunit amino acid transport system substrate-binding protein
VLTIGVSVPESGAAAVYATLADGIKARVAAVNAAGGINGYKFKVDEQDNGYSDAQAISVARGFAAEKAVAMITVPPVTGLQTVLKQIGIPVLAASAGNFSPAITNYFGMIPDLAAVARHDVRFIVQTLKLKTMSLVYEDDTAGQPAAGVMPGYAKTLGAQVVASEPADLTTTDFSPIANRLKSANAPVVDVAAGPTIVAGVQKAAAAIGYNPKWVALFVTNSPAYLALAGKLANGVYVGNFEVPTTNSAWATFLKQITPTYPGDKTNTFAQQGWTDSSILLSAIQKATNGGAKLTNTSLLQSLNSLTADQIGLLPNIQITSSQHVVPRTYNMLQITGTNFKPVTSFTPLT